MAHVIHLPDLARQLLALPNRHVWADYDEAADVLYISFQKPQQANDSIMEEDDVIYHYRDGDLVGVSIVGASRWREPGTAVADNPGA
jgi:uncharacterized protein YuzE